MGGLGSGRYGVLGASKCEDYSSLDLAWLKREGLLKPNRSSSISFNRGGNESGGLTLIAGPGGVRLIYRTRSYHEPDWQDIDEFIQFTFTDTNFGGRRKWFECPSCHYACRVLYGGKYYRCRKCHNLKYDSQYEQSWSRSLAQARKLRMKLGGEASTDLPFPLKPKGMHWKTYWRYKQKYLKHLNRMNFGLGQWIGKVSR